MTILDCLRAALQSLRANLLRSILTSLGIIIGVGAVIMMVSIGAGAEARVERLIKNLGSNIVLIFPGSMRRRGVRSTRGSFFTLTEGDAKAIATDIQGVLNVAPEVRGSAAMVFGNQNWTSSVRGTVPAFFQARNWELAKGRAFTAAEVRAAAKVIVIGQTVAEKLFGATVNPVGRTVRVKRVPFTVIGVTKAKGETPWGRDQDDVVIMPMSTAKKRIIGLPMLRGKAVANITVQAKSEDAIDRMVSDINNLLRQRHRIKPGAADDFVVRNISSFMQARQQSSQVMTILLASVAGISLLVGGIGIMNIMLVSVTERTREIGLRVAIGARRRDIMLQFVVESIVLSSIGGVIGIALGVGGSLLISKLAEWPTLIEPRAIVVAVLFSAFVGIFFGFYPARKAAQLDPINALRSD